jgi:hypothetical protein
MPKNEWMVIIPLEIGWRLWTEKSVRSRELLTPIFTPT